MKGRKGSKKSFDKENGLVVATVALCFMLTLSLCFFIGGDGIVNVVFREKTDEKSFYFICTDGGGDKVVARETASLVKKRGGAGYLDLNENLVVLSVYTEKEKAENVFDGLDYKGAYIVEKSADSFKLKINDEGISEACSAALTYFDAAFETLVKTADDLQSGTISLQEAKTRKGVLYARIEEIKSVFYQKTENFNDDEITELKLALVTCLALIDGVETENDVVAISSFRHQAVQLTYCYIALANGFSK